MRTLLDCLKEKAKANLQRIVFPEAYEEKTLRAVEILLKEKTAIPFLIGDRAQIDKKATEFGINLTGVEVRDPRFDSNFEKYVEEYLYLRKGKGVTPEIARVKILMPQFFGAMMMHTKHADGMISGLNSETKPFIAAFEIIGTKETFHKVSGLFLMLWPTDGRLLLFADSSTIIDPDAKDLAEIAIDTGETAK